MRCWPLRDVLSDWASLLLAAILACGAIVGGCEPQMPVAEYSSFGDASHARASFLPTTIYSDTAYDGSVVVAMEPREHRACRREGLSIESFESPTGSKGEAFIHYPKGIMEMQLVAYDVNRAKRDMVFEWKVVQKGRVVQEMQARVVPGPPVKVFVNGGEISVAQD